jgi:hypothetical protein
MKLDRFVGVIRSLRAPGWLDKPGALRSLHVCLDTTSPFINVVWLISVGIRG